jgi:hypothetical protein
MFSKRYEDRLAAWRSFRESLESSVDPIQDAIDFWNKAPIVNIAADPWDPETWPDPWEMIEENTYCEFLKILAIMYTLQLTERFSHDCFEIHIATTEEKRYYLLLINQRIIGYENNTHIPQNELPKLKLEKIKVANSD